MKTYQDNLYICNGKDYPVIFYGSLYNTISTSNISIIGSTATADSGSPSNLTNNSPTPWLSNSNLNDHWWEVDLGSSVNVGNINLSGSAYLGLSIIGFTEYISGSSGGGNFLTANPPRPFGLLSYNLASNEWGIDLGSSVPLHAITLTNVMGFVYQNSGTQYESQNVYLQGSNDNSNWTTIQQLVFSGNFGTGYVNTVGTSYSGTVNAAGASYRYLRIYLAYSTTLPSPNWVWIEIDGISFNCSQLSKLQGSNNGSTWTDLDTLTTNSNTVINFSINMKIVAAYRYLRFYTTYSNPGGYNLCNSELDICTLTNSANYVYLTASMGAPVFANIIVGTQTATTYSYLMTFVTAGGEEFIGTTSYASTYNGSAAGLYLYLPLGYAGTLSRKIYRTKNGDLSNYYLLATINDNTTQYYSDTTVDASLGSQFNMTVNNECPKPYFFGVANGCLYGSKNDLHPTQCYRTDTGIQVFDAANYIEIADQADDNTPVEGIGNDFGSILIPM